MKTKNDTLIENFVIDETKSDRKRIDNDIINRNAEIKYLESLISDVQKNSWLSKFNEELSLLKELDKFTDTQKYDIVHKHIYRIQIANVEGSETPTKQIKVHYKDAINNFTDIIYYCPKVRDNLKKLYVNISSGKIYMGDKIYIERF